MADVKISELTALTTPDGAEELVVNDGGTTKKITIANATSAALPKAGGTMTGVIAGFESTGIDDNATSTAITIDASENVLVGTDSASGFQSSSSATGTISYAGGAIASNVSGDAAAYFNRLSTDGTIVNLRKDGTTVGSIGSRSSGSALQIYTASTGIDFAGDGLLPMVGSTITDASRDIGSSDYRFKDAYLSGGVYLGGTGSANKLDDYEEGTFAPSVLGSSGSGTWNGTSINYGNYTKVGNVVTYVFQLAGVVSGASGSYGLFQLPFQIKTGTKASGFFGYAYNPQIGVITSHMYGDQNTSTCYLTYRAASSTTPSYHAPNHFAGSTVQYMGSITYLTN